MKQLFGEQYNDKCVLVTGHTGFKGSWLCLWLHMLGAHVIGYSTGIPTTPSLFEILKLKDTVTHIEGDVRDLSHLKKTFETHKPDIIFHLAAQALVRRSYKEPIDTLSTNCMGTANVLECVRTTGYGKTVVVVTSDKCYDNRGLTRGYSEDDPMGGFDPYSSSKGCAELITAAYRNSYFNPDEHGKTHHTLVATVRAGNIIGGGDWAEDRLVPDCIRALSRDETIIIRNPRAIRPWQFVLDPLCGYLMLGSLLIEGKKELAAPWNFGPYLEDNATVEDLVAKIKEQWSGGDYAVQPDAAYHEAQLLRLDITRAYTMLGWKPRYRIDKAVEHTIQWYHKYYKEKKADLVAFTTEQIEEYCHIKKAAVKAFPQ